MDNGITSEELARRIRVHVIEMTHASHASHVASALSVADILAVLYGGVMRCDPRRPDLPERDRLVLSKGHAGSAIYAALAERGFFPVEELRRYYTNGSPYSGHVSAAGVPGVEFSTGSLGHGVSVACGIALALRMKGSRARVFAIVGDGECDEGSVWETARLASKLGLSNFTVIVDRNRMQAMGRTPEGVSLAERWRAFGFDTRECDGHDHEALRCALAPAQEGSERPVCVVARTVKGRGVSFMEDDLLWHYRDPQGEWYERAMSELGGKLGGEV